MQGVKVLSYLIEVTLLNDPKEIRPGRICTISIEI